MIKLKVTTTKHEFIMFVHASNSPMTIDQIIALILETANKCEVIS